MVGDMEAQVPNYVISREGCPVGRTNGAWQQSVWDTDEHMGNAWMHTNTHKNLQEIMKGKEVVWEWQKGKKDPTKGFWQRPAWKLSISSICCWKFTLHVHYFLTYLVAVNNWFCHCFLLQAWDDTKQQLVASAIEDLRWRMLASPLRDCKNCYELYISTS